MWKRSKVLFALVLLMLPIGIGRADEGWGTVSREKSNVDLGTLETSVVGEMKVRNAGVSASDGKVVSATMSQDPGSFWNGGVKNGSAAYEGTQNAEAKANVYHLRMQGLVQMGGAGGGGAGGQAPTSYKFTATGNYKIVPRELKLQYKLHEDDKYYKDVGKPIKILLGQSIPFRVVDKETGEEIPLDNVQWDGDFGNLGGGIQKDVLCNKASETDTDYRKVVVTYRDTHLEGLLLVCDTVIGIHSTIEPDTPWIIDHGHVFISIHNYQKDKAHTCYGLYPNRSKLSRLIKERKSKKKRGKPISPDCNVYTCDQIEDSLYSRYYLVNPSSKIELSISQLITNAKYNLFMNNCATWAKRIYVATTHEFVQTDDKVGLILPPPILAFARINMDTPRKCSQSIIQLEIIHTQIDDPYENRILIDKTN